jgi:hypothetical protein
MKQPDSIFMSPHKSVGMKQPDSIFMSPHKSVGAE